MKKKINELVNDRELTLRERLFRVILLVGSLVSALAILAGLAMENRIVNAGLLCVLLIVMGAASLATFKYHKMDFVAVSVGGLIVALVFPGMFFASGGIDGGATVWFVLGILYIFLMFTGKELILFLLLAVFMDTVTYTAAYLHPEWINLLASKLEIYYDSFFAVLAVGISVGCIMKYQIWLFEKEREITLAQKEELEKVSQSKDAFFANMSHEIRTPINTIIGLNEMILREDISDEILEDAINIQNASKVLLDLINEILDFSKIENKKMEVVPVEYQTKELFRELVNMVQIRMKEKNLKFVVHVDETLPSVLKGDEKRIKQVALNILTNAVKYTSSGSVTLQANGEQIDTDTIKLKISVADTGIGIRKEDLESLYDSFKRVDIEKNHKIEGTGLGLTISKQLMDLMGGEITVDSIYRKGSVFTIILEQKIVDQEPIGWINYTIWGKESYKNYYKQSFEASEAKILIVDDDEINLMVACKLLRATKVQIDTARSGRECLEKTRKKMYHVILMDYVMPELNGAETLKEIRKQENGLCRQVPVVALTANASGEEKKKYLAYGFDGYIAKPVDGKVMEAEILKFLPEDILEYRRKEDQKEAADTAPLISHRKRKKIIVTSDCVCDLPKELREKYDIRMMYLYIETDKGCFRDTKEIDADNLSRYLSSSKSTAYAVSAPVEEYEAFYAEMLTLAENVIHISLAAHAGKTYGNAVAGAKGFDHVHVIDSGHISCGQGIMVLHAANMAKQGYSLSEICMELESVKDRIETSFLLPSVKIFYKNGYIDQVTAKFCDYFNLHPVLKMRRSSLKLYGARSGKMQIARKRYICQKLFWKKRIDNRVIYITYAGCTVEEQKEFVKEIKKHISFKQVIIQKASVSTACNSGLGTIGMAYYTKGKGKIRTEDL